MAKVENLPARVSVVQVNDQDVLRINKKKGSILFGERFSFFILGFLLGILLGYIVYGILKSIKGIHPILPYVSIGIMAVVTGFLLMGWFFSGNLQTKPYYLDLTGGSYAGWVEGYPSRAEKGKGSNLYVRILQKSAVEGTKSIAVRRNQGKHLYDGDCFIPEDITCIKEYFKKNGVEVTK